ncbi:MAG: HPr family phosphocarrier protein [Alphaproteobacteria bacterium]
MATDRTGDAASASRSVVIRGALGLHARPAARFVKLASSFASEIEVTAKGITVSGRSIMGLMMLGAGDGTELAISACGPDAVAAVDALCRFIAGGFAEG